MECHYRMLSRGPPRRYKLSTHEHSKDFQLTGLDTQYQSNLYFIHNDFSVADTELISQEQIQNSKFLLINIWLYCNNNSSRQENDNLFSI